MSVYHCVCYLKDANAQIFHNTIQHALGVSIYLEPLGLFDDLHFDDNRRPDILLFNPYGTLWPIQTKKSSGENYILKKP